MSIFMQWSSITAVSQHVVSPVMSVDQVTCHTEPATPGSDAHCTLWLLTTRIEARDWLTSHPVTDGCLMADLPRDGRASLSCWHN